MPGAIDTEIRIDGDKSTRVATVHYQKEGETGARFPFRLESVMLDYLDRRGKPVTSAVAIPHLRDTFDDLEADMNEHEKVALRVLRRMITRAMLIDGESDIAVNEFRGQIENSLFREKRDSARRMAWKRLIDSPKFLEHAEIEGERIKCAR